MSTTAYPETAIVWGDVETTGLKGHQEQLLEVAFLVTDLDLNLLDETGYQAAVYLGNTTDVAEVRAGAVPFVQQMHDNSGLWGACADPSRSKPLAVVEAEVLAYIRRFVPEPKTARLGGNSVRLDLNFLDEHTPLVSEHLLYRMLDVSTITGVAQWRMGLEPFEKQRNHTAMADIRESIAELKYLFASGAFPRPVAA